MVKQRILIVDDSALIRRSLTTALSAEPDFEVVGSAPNETVALMKIPILRPDVVALNIKTSGADILDLLAAIRKLNPQLSVLMLSESTQGAAAATIEALAWGALDYVTKPLTGMRYESNLQAFSHQVISKLREYRPDPVRMAPVNHDEIVQYKANPATDISSNRIDVVVIGVSTGGPNALIEVLPQLPADFPVPVLIVQHMPPMFTTLLARRLAAKCKLRVAEANSGRQILPGCVWIAPGDHHLAVARERHVVRMVTHRGPLENSCRPSVDVLFRSVAEVYGSHVLAVVMTGMGKDGSSGCEQIHARGGQILVQDKASAIVWGMPSFVVTAGLADRIVPLNRLGSEIIERVVKSRSQEPRMPTCASGRES
jgi:two-component system chemotaxis response regulator CheB